MRWLIRLCMNHTFPAIVKGIKLLSQGALFIIQYILCYPVMGGLPFHLQHMQSLEQSIVCCKLSQDTLSLNLDHQHQPQSHFDGHCD